MNLQYISNATGETTGIYIPITDWEKLKAKFVDLEKEIDIIPDWHKEIVLERIKTAKPDDYVSWNEAKKHL